MESQLTGQLRRGAALLTASALTAAGLVFGGAVFAPTDSAHAADEATVSGASLTWGGESILPKLHLQLRGLRG